MTKTVCCSFVIGVFMLLMSASVFSATIFLKDGKEVSGNIVERQADRVTLETSGVNVVYWMDEVDRIQEDSQGASAALPAETVPQEPSLEQVMDSFLKTKDYPAAIKYLENVIQKTPDAWPPYVSLAIIQYRLGNFEQALQTLDSCAGFRKNSRYYDLYRALSYRALGKDREANEALAPVIELLEKDDSMKRAGQLDVMQALIGSR